MPNMSVKPFLISVRRILFHYDWEIVEVQAAFFKIGWGVWLLLPFQTFTNTGGYSVLASLAKEPIIGIFITAIGILHIIAIISHNIKFRRNMIFFSIMFWLFMCFVFGLTRIGALIVPLMMVIGFFLTINYLRLSLPQLFIDSNIK